MAKYNGHKSWAYWNVSLWIGNSEELYNLAREYIRRSKNKDEAARRFVDDLRHCKITQTPDGAKYSYSAVRAALSSL
jgi:hypothetical protein